MNNIFNQMPKCEICGELEATHFSSVKTKDYLFSDWKFVCGKCERNLEYDISINDFVRSNKSTIEWLDHLYEKNGMDWESFLSMIHRFNQYDTFQL